VMILPERKTDLDVVTLGELLVDFVASQPGPLARAPGFVKADGGAPANVAVGASRLGLRSGFIGKVGDDAFGRSLSATLKGQGVDTAHLKFSSTGRTALAFVSLREDGERDFLFYWERSADQLLEPADIDRGYLLSGKIFHFGSISLINSPSNEATLHALQIAKDNGLFISCDPNIRPSLWPDMVRARKKILGVLGYADLVKLSGEDLESLTGQRSVPQGVWLLRKATDGVVVVTLGAQGCYYDWGQHRGYVPGYEVEAVDTTGAGDGFMAALLLAAARVLRTRVAFRELSPVDIQNALLYANAVGALTTTRKGGIPALPTAEEVDAFLEGRSREG